MAVILARKYCFVLAIIATYRFPLIQIFLLTIINSLKAYFSFKRPFKENNRKEIISEVILAVSSFTFIIFLFDETFTEEQMFSLGWVQCFLFFSIFMINMGYIIGEQLSEWKESFNKLWSRITNIQKVTIVKIKT